MVPEGWDLVEADDVCEQVRVGIVVKPKDYYVPEGQGVRAFRSANVREGFVEDSNWIYISEAGHNKNKKSILQAGDVLVVRTGYPGTACVVPESYAGSNCIDIIFARPNQSQVLPKYLCDFTNSEYGKKQVLDGQGGLAQQHFNVGAYKKLRLPLPPLPEQRKIADILSTWDEAIEKTEALLTNAQTQKRALMQQLLTGKRRFPEFEGQPWVMKKIAEIATEASQRNKQNELLTVISCTKTIGFVNSLDYFKKKVFSDDLTGYKRIHRNQIGYPSNHIEEGSIGIQTLHDVALVSPIYTVFETNDLMNSMFLFRVLKTERYRQEFAAATNASVDRRGSLRWKAFSLIKVPCPTGREQRLINDVLDAADAEIAKLSSQVTKIRSEKKALMQQLLSGKRRVVVDA